LKKPRVIVLDGGYPSYDYEEKLLRNAGFVFQVYNGDREDLERKIEFARDAVGIFIRWSKLDEHFFSRLPNLKAVVRYGVGYDNIDLQAASARGVKVANVQGYANHAVSDHALAMMYACARCLPMGQKLIHKKFGQPPNEHIFEFHDKTLGIVGLGRIGGTLCKKSVGLFKQVLAFDPYKPDSHFRELGAIRSDLKTLLIESHVISLHCNLTKETTCLIDSKAFEKMFRQPILINTARGPVVDEEALLNALNTSAIHSAGLDVYWDEPPTHRQLALLKHPRVIATGHYAWYSDTAAVELQRRAAKNMVALLQGKIPEDCLNP